ncbi:MAG: hypothetical protein ACFE0J_11140 [Elainellaceae cyanobacterium]
MPVPKQRNNVLGGLLDAGNPDDELWADSAHRSEATERAQTDLGLKNLSYNLKRFVFWQSQKETTATVTG